MTTKPEVLKTLTSDALAKVNQGKKRTYSFNVNFSDINPDFVGKFTVHHPSQMERMHIGSTVSALLGGNLEVDMMTSNIATIVATLDVVLDEYPNWFNPYSDLLEYEILEAVFLEYTTWLNSFRRTNKPSNNEEDSTGGQSEVRVVDTN